MAEIDMTKPQPCTKYRDAERMAWIAKLIEETHEVVQEAQIVAQLEKADEEALSTVLCEEAATWTNTHRARSLTRRRGKQSGM